MLLLSSSSEDQMEVQSVLSSLFFFLLVPPLLHLRQPLQDLVHGLLVSGLLSQTQSLFVDPDGLIEASCGSKRGG